MTRHNRVMSAALTAEKASCVLNADAEYGD
jgi:hypothetical protein